jgi:hypothetical protein
MAVPMLLNIRLAPGVRPTPSGAFEDRGVSQAFTATVTAGDADCGAECATAVTSNPRPALTIAGPCRFA